MKPRTASFIIILLVTILLLTPALLVFLADPYQIYHRRPLFKQAKFAFDHFYQHAGSINTLLTPTDSPYNMIVIGASTASNYTNDLFSELTHWPRALNLAINGGTPLLSATVARHAIAKKPNLDRILWDIHFLYLHEPDYEGPRSGFPFYLYNSDLLDDHPYIFNTTNLATSMNFLRGNFSGYDFEVEKVGPWHDGLVKAGRFEFTRSAEYRRSTLAPLLSEMKLHPQSQKYRSEISYPSIDKNLLQIIIPLCGSETAVDIFFSPMRRFYYASGNDDNFIYRHVYMRRYIVEKTSHCKNISVYGFDNEDWISADLDNYADDVHYKTSVNRYIITSINEGRHKLTTLNISEYEKIMLDKINDYKSVFDSQLREMENIKQP